MGNKIICATDCNHRVAATLYRVFHDLWTFLQEVIS